jgi:hypothetical protein
MDLNWVISRMRVMGARELNHRGVQYLRNQMERAGVGLVKPAHPSAARGQPWVESFSGNFAIDTYRNAAERILEGEFRLFGRAWVLGCPPRWNRDPKSGKRAPLTFGKTLDYRNEQAVGDIKYLWEPNRHLELTTLAQAWRLTGERRFAQGVQTLVESWIEQCPYPMGPNWSSSLEVALRLANWSCAWHLLGGDGAVLFRDAVGDVFKERWLSAVRQHCHFVAGYLSSHSSANNHLLGELLGLILGATTWPCWPESRLWRTQALQRFEHQALLQNEADGVNKEQAIWYHHEVADMMLLAGLTARANGCDFSRAFWDRLEAMLDFISSCMDVGGHLPAFGDSDDAVMVRFSPAADFCVFRSLLASGSVLFSRGDFKHKAQEFDDKSRWLLGDAAADEFAALASDSSGKRLRRSFSAGGYYVLGSDFETAREVRIVVDTAPLGYLAIAAHGHADALSLTLSTAGRPMLIDPGTYCYHTQRRWRDYFRGTSAHNTVRIDRVDQSVSRGTFLWMDHADARCLSFDRDSECQRIVAQHDGYRRLADPVLHRREIIYERAARRLKVTDHVICAAPHHVEIFWHFAPDCVLTLDGGVAVATGDKAGLRLRWPPHLQAELVSGRVEPCLGWVSPQLDEKFPCTTLVACGDIAGNWEGTTEIAILLER